MHYQIRKVKNKKCFSVKNKKNGKIRAKCTTKKKAIKQVRLLYMIDGMKK